MAFENAAALNYAIVYPEYFQDPVTDIRNMVARVEQRAIVSMKNTDWGLLADHVFIDPYAKWHVSDSALWLMLFSEAYKIDQEMAAVLFYIRGGGTTLVKDAEFGYRLVPVIGENGWPSQSVYDQEKQYLGKYASQFVVMLKNLSDVGGCYIE